MADKKISELTALTGANVATDDQLVIVDTSAALTKNITIDEFKNALDTATGFVRITGDTMTGNLSMGDNVKAIFGSGSDLQIYHDGSNSFINDGGIGSLKIRADQLRIESADGSETLAVFNQNSDVFLRHDNTTRLATSSSGVDITGVLTSDGLTVGDNSTSEIPIYFNSSSTDFSIGANGNNFILAQTTGDLDSNQLLTVTSTGSVGIGTSSPSSFSSFGNNLVVGGGSSNEGMTIYSSSVGSFYFADGTTGDSLYKGIVQYEHATDSLNFYANYVSGDSPNMRIDSSGNVGIGTDSPNSYSSQTTLTINGSTYGRLDIESGGTLRASLFSTTGSTTLSAATDLLSFDTSGGEAMRIASTGELLVGTTSDTMPAAAAAGQAIMAGTRTFIATETGGDTILGGTTGSNFTAIYQGGTERMRIDSSGNVGIGTDAPSAKLEIKDTVTASTDLDPTAIKLYNSSDGGSAIEFSNAVNGKAKLSFGVTSAGGGTDDTYIGFSTSANTVLSEAMRIDSSGSLLHGTTSSSIYNDTSGNGVNIKGQQGQIIVAKQSTSASDPAMILNNTGTDSSIIQFSKDGSSVGSIGVNNTDNLFISGNSTHAGLEFLGVSIAPHKNGSLVDNTLDIGTGSNRFDDIYATNGTIQTSDRNEKQDIAELSDAEQRVAVAAKGLLRKFRWKDAVEAKGDEARTHFGIIAQDLQAAFAAEGLDAGDYAMFISSTWTDEETGEERTRMGVRYSELLAFIIAAI